MKIKKLNTSIKRLINELRHSQEFVAILAESEEKRAKIIKALTHASPLLVFWVDPEGKVINAKGSHHDNPPDGDRSILVDPKHKGYLRGRSVFIGDVIYIVIYGESEMGLSRWQQALLRRTYPRILKAIGDKNPDISKDVLGTAIFIDEEGEDLPI